MPAAVPQLVERDGAADTGSGGGGGGEKCSRCGAAFTCGAVTKSTTCWCFSMPRLEKADLSGTCLCSACLGAVLALQQPEEI